MENEPVEPPKKNRRSIVACFVGIATLFVVVIALAVFLACAGAVFPLQILFYTFLGWLPFLNRVIPQMTVSVSGLVTTFLLVVIMAVVMQLLGGYTLRRLQTQNTIAVPKQWRVRWTFALIALVVLSFTGGFAVVGVAHQTVWLATVNESLTHQGVSEAARRSQSRNNLKQIGLALHNYHDTFEQFPSGGSFSQAGQPQHSWITRIIPFLDQAPLYNQIDFHQPWTAEANRKIFETRLYALQIPGMGYAFDNGKSREENAKGYQPAHYAANSRVLNVNSGMKFKEITDGTSHTILAGEIKSNIKAWGDPINFRDPTLGINQSPHGFGSPFAGGAHVLFCDGRVHFVTDKVDPQLLKTLSTPAGGEPVGDF